MEAQIRPAQLSDLPYIYDICLRTGLSGQDATPMISDPQIIGQYYGAPYCHFEIDLCFVVIKDLIPFGYIVGTSKTANFYDWMNSKWLPQIRRMYPQNRPCKSDFERFVVNTINSDCHFADFLAAYPAHLHIDLLPAVQKQGMGSKLLTRFIEALQKKGTAGLHLSVGEKNIRAIQFYEKGGFTHITTRNSAVYMGMKL